MRKQIYIVKLSGYGYKNGNVRIDKQLEFENINDYQKFTSQKTKYDEISRVINFHYPNVEFDPKKITINTNTKKVKSGKQNDKKSMAASAIGGFVAGRVSKGQNKPTNKKAKEQLFVNELNPIINISFSRDINDITKKLDEIYFGIKSYKWKYSGNDENTELIKQNNRALTKCLNKYEQGLRLLFQTTNDEEIRKEYNSKFKKLNRKKGFDKFGIIALLIIGFLLIIFILWLRE